MQLVRKIQTCFITFILIITSFSFIVLNSDSASSFDIFGPDVPDADLYQILEELLGKVLTPHPYRFVASYYVNESQKISGDITFDLFFSATFLSQLGGRYKEKINVSLHCLSEGEQKPQQIKNANKTIELNPELLGEYVQEYNGAVVFKDIDFELESGDTLFVLIEIIQSEKPIAQFIEKKFDKKIKGPLNKIADLFNSSQDVQIQEIGLYIDEILLLLDEYGIGAEDIADLANSLRSSAFYYGSKSYNSSVFIPIESGENKTLFFQNYLNLDYDEMGMGFIKTLNETKPSSDVENAYPPLLINPEGFDGENNTGMEDWMGWFLIWLVTAVEPPTPEDEDIIKYYLNSGGELTLSKPQSSSPSRASLKTSQSWKGISVNRNKIIINATAELYLYFPKFIYIFRPSVNVTLYDETAGKTIATGAATIDRSNFLEILQRGPDYPTEIELEIIEKEIWYDHNINLIVSSTGGPFAPLKSTTLIYNGESYESSVILRLGETDNIKIVDNLDYYEQYVIPGGSAEFVVNVSSKYKESLNIEVNPIDSDDINLWTIEYPDSVKINENDNVEIHIFVNSTENNSDAYDSYIDLYFNVSGLTGFDSKEAYVEVSDDAVEFDIDVVAPDCKEIKHGEKGTYDILIRNNNTGFWFDSYTIEAESEHGWTVGYEPETFEIDPYYDKEEEYVLKINITVPEFTEISKDKLTVKIISNEADFHGVEENITLIITTKVIEPNIFEHIYHFFEIVGEDIGLDDVLGDYAGGFLLFIVLFIILIFVILILFIITRKYLEVICLDRVKEVTPDEEANYNITIKNPSKKNQSYTINAVMESEFEGWEITLDKSQVDVPPKESVPIILIVKPTDNIKSNDWLEAKVIVKIIGKNKTSEISTVTSIVGGKPDIKISGVFHWPRVFKKGEKVETSFRLRNNGNISAHNINVILLINGKEKNKVEGITIPRGGYAEIEIPWIAVKGKNKVDIVVK